MTAINNQTTKNESFVSPIYADSIRDCLAGLWPNNIDTIDVFSSVTSTNDYLAQEKFADKNDIAICVADEQTQGRGRFGHQWSSPPGVNLYLSLLWPLEKWHKQYEALSLWLLIALAELLEQLEFVGIQLKWPNDICIDNKKLGGILIERKLNRPNKNLIIGVGLNIAMSKTKHVQIETPWIDLISKKPDWAMSRNEFTANVLAALIKALDKLDKNTYVNFSSMWRRYDLMYQRQIVFTYQNKRKVGIAQGVDELGRIIMNIGGKVLHLHSSHVSDIKL